MHLNPTSDDSSEDDKASVLVTRPGSAGRGSWWTQIIWTGRNLLAAFLNRSGQALVGAADTLRPDPWTKQDGQAVATAKTPVPSGDLTSPEERPISELREIPKLSPPPQIDETPAPMTPENEPELEPQLSSNQSSFIEDLFDELVDLSFKESLEEGAEFVLDVALKFIPSHAGLIHLYDINKAEFMIVAARGTRCGPVLGSRFAQADPVASEALRAQATRQLPLSDLPEEDRSVRVRTLTPVRSVLVAPCQSKGQDVGGIELYDSKASERFSEAELNALEYLSHALTTFVLEKGLVLNPAKMAPIAPEPPSIASA